jgi:plastocyanin
MNTSALGVVVVVILLGLGLYAYTSTRDQTPSDPDININATRTPQRSTSTNTGTGTTSNTGATNTGTGTVAPVAKTFNVVGSSFSFDVKEMRVKQGDTVTVNFRNADGLHDWVIDEFNARTDRINAGGTDTVTFVASKKGTFEYYCSVGNHRAMGMVGKLIVE